MEFTSTEDAAAFQYLIEKITLSAGSFISWYEVPQNVAFMRGDFDMVKLGYVNKPPQAWMATSTESSEWRRLRRTGEWSDLTIAAEDETFDVHRFRLCQEFVYFRDVCSESSSSVFNSMTGSLFTGFALRSEIEKARHMAKLLDIFIAADKYGLKKVKHKVSEAIIDRLPFVIDTMIMVDVAINVYNEQFPCVDSGLHGFVIAQIDARLPAILEDQGVWNVLAGSKTVLKALHGHQCDLRDNNPSRNPLTPPVSRTSNQKKRRAQDMARIEGEHLAEDTNPANGHLDNLTAKLRESSSHHF
ncbi:hypothetical protein FB567DRAFT_605987 [Paraphoma chrysanthemicola]|uniref:BTB domain-containing protein n=1 Tax=Paraphoma chrysanthemicola TaxID=798071 RepID=A0A8K0VVL2_9PLEO|nr:hypothetical protein FB567DRAFT_605987 [Paraphoma chrysanthemicola]